MTADEPREPRWVCWDIDRNEPCTDPDCRADRPDLHEETDS